MLIKSPGDIAPAELFGQKRRFLTLTGVAVQQDFQR